jgi:hypothetical protein
VRASTAVEYQAFNGVRSLLHARGSATEMADARAMVGDTAQQAGAAARTYVTANPWKAAGMLAAAGVIFGFALAQCRSASAINPAGQGKSS